MDGHSTSPLLYIPSVGGVPAAYKYHFPSFEIKYMNSVVSHWSQTAEFYLGQNFREVLAISEAHQFNVLINIMCILGLIVLMFIWNIYSREAIIEEYQQKMGAFIYWVFTYN